MESSTCIALERLFRTHPCQREEQLKSSMVKFVEELATKKASTSASRRCTASWTSSHLCRSRARARQELRQMFPAGVTLLGSALPAQSTARCCLPLLLFERALAVDRHRDVQLFQTRIGSDARRLFFQVADVLGLRDGRLSPCMEYASMSKKCGFSMLSDCTMRWERFCVAWTWLPVLIQEHETDRVFRSRIASGGDGHAERV